MTVHTERHLHHEIQQINKIIGSLESPEDALSSLSDGGLKDSVRGLLDDAICSCRAAINYRQARLKDPDRDVG